MKKTSHVLALCLVLIAADSLAQQPGPPPLRAPPPPPRDWTPPAPPNVTIPPRPPDAVRKPADVETMPLFLQAKKANAQRYEFAVRQKATFHATPDGKSFYVLWLPEKADPKAPVPMIVTLHGHGSWAFDELFLWHTQLAQRGYGILALQWWFGQGEKQTDYYQPNEIYRIVDGVLKTMKVPKQSVLLHGFSRGSANIYGVTAFDRSAKNNFVALTVANAGKAGGDFPINEQLSQGRFGDKPFEGTHWVMYAGAQDTHPDRDGIPGMREARDWVTRLGGTVDLLIEDAKGDHGGFHRNPENIKAALDVFAKRLTESKAGDAPPASASPEKPR